MNYLRGAISAGYQYYKELPPINPSTLTGAIDVIVVQRYTPAGELELACTPFHVRFGKWQVLRPGDKKVGSSVLSTRRRAEFLVADPKPGGMGCVQVNVFVNGRPIPFNMKIGEAGEAFFVFETDEDVPADLMTSPILEATNPSAPKTATSDAQLEQKQHTGRFGVQTSDTSPGDADLKGTSQVEEEERKLSDDTPIAEPDFLDLDAVHGDTATTATGGVSAASLPTPFIDLPPADTPPVAHDNLPDTSTIPETPSEVLQPSSLLVRSTELGTGLAATAVRALKEEVKDHVGQFRDQTAAARNIAEKRLALHLPSRKVGNEDKGGDALPYMSAGGVQAPSVAYKHDIVLDMEGYHSRERSDGTITGSEVGIEPVADEVRHEVKEHGRGYLQGDLISTEDDLTPTSSRAQSPEPSTPGTPPSRHGVPIQRAISEPPEIGNSLSGSPPQYSWEWGNFPKSASIPKHAGSEPGSRAPERASSHRFIPSTLSTTRDEKSAAVVDEELTVHFGKGGRLTADDAEGFVLEFDGRTVSFDLSLCGDLGEVMKQGNGEAENAVRRFAQHRVTFQQFIDDPAIVHNDDLCVRWMDRFISRKDSSPVLAALIVWRQSTLRAAVGATSEEEPLSSSDERDLPRSVAESQPAVKTNRSSWRLGWWRNRSAREVTAQGSDSKDLTSGFAEPQRPWLQPAASAPDSLEAVPRRSTSLEPAKASTEPVSPPKGRSRHYVKTLRLTSDQLRQLNLKKGPNSITFSLSANVVTCTARIFVWDSSDKVVISDIDGTITKSDALGHVFTMIGRDWTHLGVAKLYTDICRNGYKIMYLTARAIGQADSTREYLKGINQNNYQLPEGPVIMSPDRLMASLHREVIMRQPEVFKMACLRDIQRVFGESNRNPFSAGFGNRITDALSYRSVNVPSGRIFTIDSSGEVKMELLELAGYKSSYIHMTDLVDQMFPPIHRKWAPEFTDVNFWRPQVGEYDLPEDLSPPSPALSARSDVSGQTRLSRLRNFSLLPSSGPSATATAAAAAAVSAFSRTSPTIPNGHSRHTSASSSLASESTLEENERQRRREGKRRLSNASIPGSLEGFRLDDDDDEEEEGGDDDEDGDGEEDDELGEDEDEDEEEGEDEYEDEYEEEKEEEDEYDELLATGEMDKVPFL